MENERNLPSLYLLGAQSQDLSSAIRLLRFQLANSALKDFQFHPKCYSWRQPGPV